jgi:flagellar FliJ protein
VAFKFGLESVLKHRKRLEDIAQREFAEAQASVDDVLRRLEEMYRRMDEVREEIRRVQSTGHKEAIAEICAMEQFLMGQKIRIESVRQEARQLLQVAEEKQEALVAAAREKKVLVKLKEKRMAEYRQWLERVEAKMLDDQAMMARAWGKR